MAQIVWIDVGKNLVSFVYLKGFSNDTCSLIVGFYLLVYTFEGMHILQVLYCEV